MRKGVTLIELLIVMIIVAILSIVIFVSMPGSVDQSQEAAFLDFMSNARTAVRSYNARCLQINPMGDAVRLAGSPGTVMESLSWIAFLTGSGLTAIKIDASEVSPPLGSDWLPGISSGASIRASYGSRFDSVSCYVKRVGREWRLHKDFQPF